MGGSVVLCVQMCNSALEAHWYNRKMALFSAQLSDQYTLKG